MWKRVATRAARMFPQSCVAPVGCLRAGRSHWRTLAGLASARNKSDHDTLENTCCQAKHWPPFAIVEPPQPRPVGVALRVARLVRYVRTRAVLQGPRAMPPVPRPVIYLPRKGAGDRVEGAGSTTPHDWSAATPRRLAGVGSLYPMSLATGNLVLPQGPTSIRTHMYIISYCCVSRERICGID